MAEENIDVKQLLGLAECEGRLQHNAFFSSISHNPGPQGRGKVRRTQFNAKNAKVGKHQRTKLEAESTTSFAWVRSSNEGAGFGMNDNRMRTTETLRITADDCGPYEQNLKTYAAFSEISDIAVASALR